MISRQSVLDKLLELDNEIEQITKISDSGWEGWLKWSIASRLNQRNGIFVTPETHLKELAVYGKRPAYPGGGCIDLLITNMSDQTVVAVELKLATGSKIDDNSRNGLPADIMKCKVRAMHLGNDKPATYATWSLVLANSGNLAEVITLMKEYSKRDPSYKGNSAGNYKTRKIPYSKQYEQQQLIQRYLKCDETILNDYELGDKKTTVKEMIESKDFSYPVRVDVEWESKNGCDVGVFDGVACTIMQKKLPKSELTFVLLSMENKMMELFSIPLLRRKASFDYANKAHDDAEQLGKRNQLKDRWSIMELADPNLDIPQSSLGQPNNKTEKVHSFFTSDYKNRNAWTSLKRVKTASAVASKPKGGLNKNGSIPI